MGDRANAAGGRSAWVAGSGMVGGSAGRDHSDMTNYHKGLFDRIRFFLLAGPADVPTIASRLRVDGQAVTNALANMRRRGEVSGKRCVGRKGVGRLRRLWTGHPKGNGCYWSLTVKGRRAQGRQAITAQQGMAI